MQIKETQLDYSDVLIVPQPSKVNSRSDVSLIRTVGRIPWTGIPVVAANMATTGTLNMAEALTKHMWLTCLHKHYTANDLQSLAKDVQYFSAPTIGMDTASQQTFYKVMEKENFFKFVCIDVANGYIESFKTLVKNIRSKYGDRVNIIAGNVVTPEGVEALWIEGADFVKVGIGPGSRRSRLCKGWNRPRQRMYDTQDDRSRVSPVFGGSPLRRRCKESSGVLGYSRGWWVRTSR